MTADRAAVLAREELPRCIGQLEQRLELARQTVAEEKNAFLVQHTKDTETMDIILANIHMEQERQKGKLVKRSDKVPSGEIGGGPVEAEVLQREDSAVFPDKGRGGGGGRAG